MAVVGAEAPRPRQSVAEAGQALQSDVEAAWACRTRRYVGPSGGGTDREQIAEAATLAHRVRRLPLGT